MKSPHQESLDPTWMEKTGGFAKDMTFRDHFAAMAMQGMLAENGGVAFREVAKWAYAIADEMLKARHAK